MFDHLSQACSRARHGDVREFTKRVTFQVFLNMGVLAALAGLVVTSRLNAASPKAPFCSMRSASTDSPGSVKGTNTVLPSPSPSV